MKLEQMENILNVQVSANSVCSGTKYIYSNGKHTVTGYRYVSVEVESETPSTTPSTPSTPSLSAPNLSYSSHSPAGEQKYQAFSGTGTNISSVFLNGTPSANRSGSTVTVSVPIGLTQYERNGGITPITRNVTFNIQFTAN